MALLAEINRQKIKMYEQEIKRITNKYNELLDKYNNLLKEMDILKNKQIKTFTNIKHCTNNENGYMYELEQLEKRQRSNSI
jgi:uncharacterized coiled-coil DUF342 family protein